MDDDALLEDLATVTDPIDGRHRAGHFGSFAAEHLSPSYPQRAPWGTAQRLRAWQAEALDRYFGLDGPDGRQRTARLPRRRDAGRRKDHVRAAPRQPSCFVGG